MRFSELTMSKRDTGVYQVFTKGKQVGTLVRLMGWPGYRLTSDTFYTTFLAPSASASLVMLESLAFEFEWRSI